MLRTEKTTMKAALATLGKGVKRSILPILDCVLIEPEVMRTSCLGFELRLSGVLVQTEEPFEPMAVPFESLKAAVNSLPDGLAFELISEKIEGSRDRRNLIIRQSKTIMRIQGYTANEWPEIAEQGGQRWEISAELFEEAASTISGFCMNDPLRPVMGGVHFNGSMIVATDSHRMLCRKVEGVEFEQEFTIPREVLLAALRKNDHPAIIGSGYISQGDLELIYKPIEDRYPNFRAVIPDEQPYSMTFDLQALRDALKIASVGESKTTHRVDFSVGDGLLLIESNDQDFGKYAKTEIEASADIAGGFQFSLNNFLFASVLAAVEEGQVCLQFQSFNRAFTIETEKWVALIMPVMKPE